jgi:dihydroorotate dehydrogenase (NAD+) catalytic subunit
VAEVEEEGRGLRLDFLLEAVGPGTERLCELEVGESVWVNGPLGSSFSTPNEVSAGVAGAILVGGGVGIAPLAIWRRRLGEGGVPVRVLLGFRDEAHSGGLDDLFRCHDVAIAYEDGHAGHRGYVTDLLQNMLLGDDATSAVVYACGPPAMLDTVDALCGEHGVPCELAMESPMACGFGACFGCAVPKPGGEGYIRLCVDGPVIRGGASLQAAVATASRAGGAVGGTALEEALATGRGGGSPAATGPAGRTAVEFCGLELKHPVINASGTFDAIAARRVYGDQLLEEFPFAAFVSKTITLEPRIGNQPQRIWETPAGMINSIGLPNRGLEGFVAEDLPRLAELPVPLIVSVMATSREDFARLVAGVGEREEVSAIELNVSCPNVHSGLIVGEQPSETSALLEALRPLTEKPLLVKLTPNVADPDAVAVAAEEAGADAVSLINTLKASAVDPATGRPGIAAGQGGLSGPAVRPIAVAQLRSVASSASLPIVGMGGIGDAAAAAEMLSAGATLVAVGTESFRDPAAGSRIARELAGRFLVEQPEPRVEVEMNFRQKP